MKTDILSKEILKALRGKLSQTQLSTRLGYGYNQVYRWESGLNKIGWLDFVSLCRARKAPLAVALRKALYFEDDAAASTSLIAHLTRGLSTNEAMRQLGCSRFTLRRWRSGETALPLEAVLNSAVHQGEIEKFVEALGLSGKVPELTWAQNQRDSARRLFEDYPGRAGLALLALDLSQYRSLSTHKKGWIADHTGISYRDEEDILTLALKAGLIRKNRDGKFERAQPAISTRGLEKADRANRAYWTARGSEMDMSGQRGPNDNFGFVIVSTDEEGEKELQAMMVELSNKILALGLAKKAKAPDRLRILTIQSFQACKKI